MDQDKVIRGLDKCVAQRSCPGCPYSKMFSAECIQKLMTDALRLIRDQKQDLDIVNRVKSGSTVKYIGKGIVILNYQWWIDRLRKKDKFSPVPSEEDINVSERKSIKETGE